MAIETTTNSVIFQGNASTTVFPYSFLIPLASQVTATFTSSAGVQTVLTTAQYTISGLGNDNGGTVTYPLSGSAMAVGESLTIERVVPYTQPTVLTNQGGYYPDVVEAAMDNIVMQTQQLAEQVDRSLQFPAVDPAANSQVTLPAWQARANGVLGFDASGNPQITTPASGLTTSADNINFLQPLTSAVSQTVTQKLRQWVNVFDFMNAAQRASYLASDLIEDMSVPIQAAIDAVSPVKAATQTIYPGTVFADERYRMRVGTAINATNSRVNGTKWRDYIELLGFNMVGDTGDGWAVIETTGSQWLRLEGTIAHDSSTSTPSSVGLFQGVMASGNTQTQNQTIKLNCQMGTDTTANSGIGRVAIWNFGAEECTYITPYLSADRCIALTNLNSGGAMGTYANSYQTLGTSHTIGVTTFEGECFFASTSDFKAPILIEGANAAAGGNFELASLVATSDVNQFGIEIRDNPSGLRLSGILEGHPALLQINASINYSDFNFTIGAANPTASSFTGSISTTTLTVTAISNGFINVGDAITGAGITAGTVISSRGTGIGGIGTYNVNHSQTVGSEGMTATGTYPLIFLERTGGWLVSTNLRIRFAAGDYATRYLWATNYVAADVISAYFDHTQVYTNSLLTNSTPPAKLIWSPYCRSSEVACFDGSYKISQSGQARVEVRGKSLGSEGSVGTTIIANIAKPNYMTNASALSAVVLAEGVVGFSQPGGSAPTSAYMRLACPAVWSNTGALSCGSQVNVFQGVQSNSAGNSVSAVAMTLTDDGSGNIQVKLTPTTTGANTGDVISFTGYTETYWQGHTANAPIIVAT